MKTNKLESLVVYIEQSASLYQLPKTSKISGLKTVFSHHEDSRDRQSRVNGLIMTPRLQALFLSSDTLIIQFLLRTQKMVYVPLPCLYCKADRQGSSYRVKGVCPT